MHCVRHPHKPTEIEGSHKILRNKTPALSTSLKSSLRKQGSPTVQVNTNGKRHSRVGGTTKFATQIEVLIISPYVDSPIRNVGAFFRHTERSRSVPAALAFRRTYFFLDKKVSKKSRAVISQRPTTGRSLNRANFPAVGGIRTARALSAFGRHVHFTCRSPFRNKGPSYAWRNQR